jgi:uncharacterized protein (TIGR00303 family)
MRPPILFAAAAERGRAFAERWRGSHPAFWCVLAHTDTCLVAGLSAAGMNEELRVFTPAADAEVVHLGLARCLPDLPRSPSGTPGPAGITRAALGVLDEQACFFGVGLRTWPETECVRISGDAGADIARAQGVAAAQELFERGESIGRDYALQADRLVLGESVPGGTTTALAVLLALGYDAAGRVSGSVPGNAHALKLHIVEQALRRAGIEPGAGRCDPLRAVGEVGDPMQPLAAGIARGATRAGCEVLLAGGSQMLAVAALIGALAGQSALDQMAIGTTRWIVADPAADVAGLASQISPELALLAANLNFSGSRHAGLQAYEQFRVKEGVGAGGACVAALLGTGIPVEELEYAIDATYDRVLSRLPTEFAP